jgi:multicomponent Na+:H+ antiporter subunit A
VPPSSGAYLGALRGVNAVANRFTAVAQPGSLPIYLGVILLTAAVVPGVLLLSGTWWPGWPDVVEVPAHVPIAALLIGLALAAAIVRRRFAGALFLGMVGYSMAALFVAQGAPDLALTQIAIETLSTVLFVLVLRRLPDRFETSRGAARRTVRIVIATIVGGLVFVFTLAVGSLDPATDVSDTMIEQAYPEGDGRNVVNVILVDIRAFDTLGEMTVLTAVAIGTVALARAGRRPARIEAEEARRGRRAAPVLLTRLVTIEVSVRIVFAAVMIGALRGGRPARGSAPVAWQALDAARQRGAHLGDDGDRAAAARRTGPADGIAHVRPARHRVDEGHLGAVLRHRRVPRRHRPGADGVRVLR